MKLIWFTMCYCGGVAIMIANAVNRLPCLGINLDDDASFLALFSRNVPKTKYHKCMYECMLRVGGVVKEDGTIISETFVNFLNKSKEYDDTTLTKIAEVTEKCKKHKPRSVDTCHTVGLLVSCSVIEANKNGLNQKTMLKALRFPYFSKDRQSLVWTN